MAELFGTQQLSSWQPMTTSSSSTSFKTEARVSAARGHGSPRPQERRERKSSAFRKPPKPMKISQPPPLSNPSPQTLRTHQTHPKMPQIAPTKRLPPPPKQKARLEPCSQAPGAVQTWELGGHSLRFRTESCWQPKGIPFLPGNPQVVVAFCLPKTIQLKLSPEILLP